MKKYKFIISIIFLTEYFKLGATRNEEELVRLVPASAPKSKKPVTIFSAGALPTQETSTVTPEVCCECSPFYLCVNGVINVSGAGVIDPRMGYMRPRTTPKTTTTESPAVNVNICPNVEEICCRLPEADPSCLDENASTLSSSEAPPDYDTLDSNSTCECVVYDSCFPELVVSNGLGNTTILLDNGRLVNHSQCLHPLEVCCYLPDNPLTTPMERYSPTLASLTTKQVIEEESCKCVEESLCEPDGHTNTFGEGVIEPRIGSSNPSEICQHDPKLVCCRKLKTNESIATTTMTTIAPTTKTSTTSKPLAECGRRNSFGVGVRILGFREGQAQFGEYPWVVTIVRREVIMGKEYPLFVGGGSLIHRRVVMTAAHKLTGIKLEDLVVRLGEWDAASTKEVYKTQKVEIQEVIIHSEYNSRSLINDVALLILKEDAKLDFHISTICLAKDLDNINRDACVINGWGTDAYRTGKYQNIVKSVQLPLVGHHSCQSLLKKTRLSKYFTLHTSFICAGGEEGIDACTGDGGGPLSCPLLENSSHYVQVGITAWGIGCGEKDVPGVYVNIPFLYTWIEDTIESHFPGFIGTTTLATSIANTTFVTTQTKAPNTSAKRRQKLDSIKETKKGNPQRKLKIQVKRKKRDKSEKE